MTTEMRTTAAPAEVEGARRQSFIEVQFPVSKLSKESYGERVAGSSQTLTSLGKWWGRKPLVLVRAIILGLLLPATEDPETDRQTFLALMTMDDDGMLRRLDGALSAQVAYTLCTPRERLDFFAPESAKPVWRREIGKADRQGMIRRAFLRMSYDQRLQHCRRSEEVGGPGAAAWARINVHLGTAANSIPELIGELGARRFGGVPRVGDVFCGGGSIPFEGARLGCEAYGSDLNPVAALLTWGALNVIGGGQGAVDRVAAAQQRVFQAIRAQSDAWGIESNEHGWIADAYLYCAEVVDPATLWRVPLATSWAIAPKFRVIARLTPDPRTKTFHLEILEGVTEEEYREAGREGTWQNGIRCPVDRNGVVLPVNQRQTTSSDRLRGSSGLRLWENDDVVPHSTDVF